MTHRSTCAVVAVALVLLTWGAPAWAQGPQGKLSGVVRDGTGSAVPGVIITATNQSTNASQSTTSASVTRSIATAASLRRSRLERCRPV